MKTFKTAIVAATMMTSASALAVEVSGNVAVGSDYFFRGYDQSLGCTVRWLRFRSWQWLVCRDLGIFSR